MVDLSNQLAEAKMVVLDHFKSVDESNLQNLTSGLVKNTHPNCQFHFVHPFPSDAVSYTHLTLPTNREV